MSLFSQVQSVPEDPIFGLTAAFKADPRPMKIDLSVGIYKNASLQSEIMPALKEAEKKLFEIETDKGYFPIDGSAEFTRLGCQLALGKEVDLTRIYSAQTVGGNSALRLGAEFLFQEGCKKIAISSPTWVNHNPLFTRAGFEVSLYRYYDFDKNTLRFDWMQEALNHLSEGTVVLLHACCHNPTGVDLSLDQWKEVSQLCKKRRLIPFFDMAYQGFGEGLEKDARALRYFFHEGHELLLAYSFSKNFGLYGERTGFFALVGGEKPSLDRCGSVIRSLIRANYSNPPRHGASLVSIILSEQQRAEQWRRELEQMRGRIQAMRMELAEATGSEYMKRSLGMFCFTGLKEEQVALLREKHAIYLPSSGRINLTGLTQSNLPRVVEAFSEVRK